MCIPNLMCLPEKEETVALVHVRVSVITSSHHLFETLRPAAFLYAWVCKDRAFPGGSSRGHIGPWVHDAHTLLSLTVVMSSQYDSFLLGGVIFKGSL